MTLLSHSFKVRHLILAAALTTGLGFVNPANAQIALLVDLDSRTAIDLGTVGEWGNANSISINDAGQVVGASLTADGGLNTFITGPDGVGMRDLVRSWSHASGINDAGQVVGGYYTADGNNHTFITGPNGMGMRDLGTLGGRWSEASGINDAGQVAGYSLTAEVYRHAFITGPDGVGMRDLGSLGGNGNISGAYVSEAYGINDAGQVVGDSLTAEGYSHAFITGPDGMGMRDLGTLGGSYSYSQAVDINDAGQVVGYSDTEGSLHAFITGPDGVGMRDLSTLGGSWSYAYGINDIGQVVGYSYTAGDGFRHAFITGPDGKGMTDLNSLVDLPQGTVIVQAMDINNSGQVIAIAIPGTIPEPEAYALMLAGLGLVGFMARRRRWKI